MNVLNDVERCRQMISTLREYKTKNWAVGLSWPNGQPDAFYQFFCERGLSCQCYLRAEMTVGDTSAYEANILALEGYIRKIAAPELALCDATLTKLRDYKAKNWAIGLMYSGTHQPDAFTKFNVTRDLPTFYYVRASNLSVGTPAAYEMCIQSIEGYKARLSHLVSNV